MELSIMIKGKWQGIVFVCLILLLAIGLSTVALHERSEQEAEKTHKMSIALVNEDAGADFNDSSINFGDEFANQMNKDQTHDWYIVSRGVAESGFERNAYDMMIVIPNNFSDNALSIDEDAPEQVTLEYRINATGHEDVRAEAEKAAGEVLTNFNKQLIDVFFVSIIGNLQEAQDHIVHIIDKEKEYTDEYALNIYNPLDNFTNQFEQVQHYADLSKNNYNQLDDVLENFESSLNDKAKTSAEYDSDLAEALAKKEESSLATTTFADQFDQFINRMHKEDADEQIKQLEAVNTYLYEQLRKRNPEENQNEQRSLQERIAHLNSQLNTVKTETDEISEFVLVTIPNSVEKKVEESVKKSFDDEKMEGIKINDLINDLDEDILQNISNSIALLPEDHEAIADLVIPEGTKVTLENIAIVSEKFKEIDEFYQKPKGEQEKPNYDLLEEPFTQVKESLIDEGFEAKDTITIKEFKNNTFSFSLESPAGFSVEDISINGQRVSVNDELTLEVEEGQEELNVDLTATFKLDEEYDDLDLFQPVEWSWTLEQENEEFEEITPDPPVDEDSNTSKEVKNAEKNEKTADEVTEDLEETPEAEVGEDEAETLAEEEGETSDEEDNNQAEEQSEPDVDKEKLEKTNDEVTEPPVTQADTVTTIHQYHWNQSVQSVLYDQKDFTKALITEAAHMYDAIHSLNTLYELYFGLDLSEKNEDLEESDLRNIAEEDSLYYLVHKKELKELIQDRISKDVAKTVTNEITDSLTGFQNQVEEYQSFIEKTEGDSEKIAEKLEEASARAETLNSSVGQVLEEVGTWKASSSDLASDQMEVLSSDGDMQTVLLSLDSGFKPILSTSESLVEQARANFDSTEHVYETLDSIDEQADIIQQSGTTLVAQASELATKFSEKAAEDMDFADNFNEVLANSRIGDRQNEDLYQFLSNPVESQNTGIIKEAQTFTPYFIVFILAIVSFFTAYVLSNHQGARIEGTEFDTDQTFIRKNMGPMLMTGGIGIIEGVLIGIITFILLDIPETGAFTWIAFITAMVLGMVLLATYALRQLHMIGMFLLLVVFSLYLLLTKSLGFQFGGNEAIGVARKISPLQQLETWIHSFIEGTMSTSTLTIAFMILIVAVIIGLALNMLIVDSSGKEVGVDDEGTKEAN